MSSSLYRLDLRKLTFQECWYQTRSSLVLVLWFCKVFGTRFPNRTVFPRINSFVDIVIPSETVPDHVRARLDPLIREMIEAGFNSPIWYRYATSEGSRETILADFLHPDGRALGRVMFVENRTVVPSRVVVESIILSRFADGSFLVTAGSRPRFRSAPGVRIIREIGATPMALWRLHQAELSKTWAKGEPVLIRTPEDAAKTATDYENVFWKDRIDRGLMVPLAGGENAAHQVEKAELAQVAEAYGAEHADVLVEIEKIGRSRGSWKNALSLLIVSLAVFVAVRASQGGWDWSYLSLLIPILFFHEFGHWVAMRIFGYRNVRMMFIPFLGAAVTGKNYNVPGWQKALVSLAGPFPGIALATAVAIATAAMGRTEELSKLIFVMIALNGFNLLPFVPFDGGWYLNSILFCRTPYLEAGFKLIASGALIFAGFQPNNTIFIYLGFLVLVSVPTTWRNGRIAQALRKQGGLPSESQDGRAIPAPTALAIIAALKARPGVRRMTTTLARQAIDVFERMNARPPHWAATLFLLVVYLGTFALGGIGLAVWKFNENGGLVGIQQQQQQFQPQPGWGPPQGRRGGGRESRLKQNYNPGEQAEWTATGPRLAATHALLLAANYSSAAVAKSAFERLSRPPAKGVAWVGQSVLVLAARDDEAGTQAVKQSVAADAVNVIRVDSAIDSWPEVEISCSPSDSATGIRIAAQMEDYFEVSQSLGGEIAPAPPWNMPPNVDAARLEADRKARNTWRGLAQAESEVRGNRTLQKLHKDSAKALKHGDTNESNKLAKEFGQRRIAVLESAIRSNVRGGGVDQEIVNGELEMARADAAKGSPSFDIRRGAEWDKLKNLLQQRLILAPPNDPAKTADDVGATGDARGWGDRLNITLAPNHPDRCLPLALKWLAEQGCNNIRYEIRGDRDVPEKQL